MTYNDLIRSGTINDMQKEVLDGFLATPLSTDNEISEFHKIKINVVTARRYELVEAGVMIDHGKRRCSFSGRFAHIWRVRTIKEIQRGKPKELGMLKCSEMDKIQKKIMKANDFQKKKIINWCNGVFEE